MRKKDVKKSLTGEARVSPRPGAEKKKKKKKKKLEEEEEEEELPFSFNRAALLISAARSLMRG
jgi:hypothetical protein